ncbi:hypothetical protein CLV58_101179 [Spirosoma oryzae]|uniref:Uncharacterized protein n=1 Tax=Spirosoma oryzae TaxID=1469603 RepID=A0A2T0TN89_9BACT|nr:hypothetical protein CLV58_101179 [Spirosoma oryzae]
MSTFITDSSFYTISFLIICITKISETDSTKNDTWSFYFIWFDTNREIYNMAAVTSIRIIATQIKLFGPL